MAIPVIPAPRTSVSRRKDDAWGQFRNYYRLSLALISHIDGVSQPLNATILMDLLWQFRQSRNALTDPNGIGFGDLLDNAVKDRFVEDHPVHYPTRAAFNADLSTANQASNALYAEVRTLLDARKAATGGTLLDYDNITDEPVDAPFQAAEMTALRAAAVALRDTFDVANSD